MIKLSDLKMDNICERVKSGKARMDSEGRLIDPPRPKPSEADQKVIDDYYAYLQRNGFYDAQGQ